MKNDLRDFLHLYTGCEVEVDMHGKRAGTFLGFVDLKRLECRLGFRAGPEGRCSIFLAKPKLRRLSSMTKQEAHHFAWLCMNTNHHPDHIPATKDEVQIVLVHNDDGLMLDDDVEVYIGVSCRCFEGWISIMKDGRIGIGEEDEPSSSMKPLDDIALKVHYLIEKRFWLFGQEWFNNGKVIDINENE